MKTILILILIHLTAAQNAVAEKLSLANHDSLIQKLESAVGDESSDAMLLQTNMAYRLAGLYAERARILSMDQEGKGEQIHATPIKRDRLKSISILHKIHKSLAKADKGPALLQIAHLHSLQGQSNEALKIYKQIERNPSEFDAKTVSLVEIQLGDLAFVQGQLDQARKHFDKALKYNENPRRGYTMFRIAWVNYNQGQTQLAEKQLIQLLRNPKSMTNAKGEIDPSFQEDVAHDLALFMAKNDITDQSIQTLSSLSPEASRKKNLIFLASELDRTAKKMSALKVWKIIGGTEITFEDQLERQVQVTRIEYDLGRKASVNLELKRSLALLKQSACEGKAECTLATQNLRRVITDWAKAEERAPSAELITAFHLFTAQIPDFELTYWAAGAAYKRKQFNDAYKFYDMTIAILQDVSKRDEKQTKLFEGSLLGSIEVAELSNKPELKLQAYKKYLSVNPTGEKSSEVKYQIAHWYYDQNDFTKASAEFYTLALDTKMPMALREKSGDLCLDADVLLKNETVIEAHALKLSEVLTSKKPEYLSVYKKSILNQAANILNKTEVAQYETQLQKLDGLNLKLFTAPEAKQVAKNKMELAYRLKNMDALVKNANLLLNQSGLTVEERDMALNHLAWIAEVKMEFKTALTLLGRIKPQSKNLPEYWLKMATLKELANEDPSMAYENFIAVSRENDKKAFAAHQIVIHSKKPMAPFKRFESLLSRNSALYGSAGIYVYEKTKDQRVANALLARKAVRQSFSGQLLIHSLSFENLQALTVEMKRAKLAKKSDSGLQRTMVLRTGQLKQLEKLANKAIAQKDTPMQLIFLAKVGYENTRLAEEILALPLPRGLKAEEKVQYQAQVAAMVKPYQVQAEAIQAKTKELWTQAIAKNSFHEFADCLVSPMKPGCKLANEEVAYLRASAKASGFTADPFEKLSEDRQKTLSEVKSLQEKIQADPFNLNDLAKLKSLQMSLGRGPMVAYLDHRMKELKTKRVQN